MKTLLVVGILLISLNGQALSMGHPHNMFAARKQLRAKASTSIAKAKPSACLSSLHTVRLTKPAFSERLVSALSYLRPTRSY